MSSASGKSSRRVSDRLVNRRKPCPVKKLDPDAAVDFSTRGTLVTDRFRKGYDQIDWSRK